MTIKHIRFSMFNLFYVLLLILFVGACSPEPVELTRSGQSGFGLNGDSEPDDFYCPEGYTYDNLYHVCEDKTGVLGPFSPAMVEKCRAFGGGAPCDGLHWQREFAHSIRGTGKCPLGTRWEQDMEVCTSGENVYGPFLKSQQRKCVAAGGGPACETMRWSMQFFESFRAEKRVGNGGISGNFDMPEPSDAEISEVLSLWATYYYIPTVQNLGSNGIPLLDMNGNSLGVGLSRKDWCKAALEGSVRVVDSVGKDIVFNYAGSRQSYKQTDCSDHISLPGLPYSRFYRAKGSFGDGVAGYHLKPYRTIAVDPSYIPYGTVIYIPAARGITVILPNGKQALHDGYFYAADTGGALYGRHIDVFIGSAGENPFSFVRSNSSGTFKAFIISSRDRKAPLESLHTTP